jgi:hypothetical protein
MDNIDFLKIKAITTMKMNDTPLLNRSLKYKKYMETLHEDMDKALFGQLDCTNSHESFNCSI